MDTEQRVAQHYAQEGLEQVVLQALRQAGKDIDKLVPADLAPVDEFHIGGRQATVDFAAELPLRPGRHLLDIGSGIGGASRYFAEAHDCQVTGIDLTAGYVATATALAQRVGLADRVSYRQGSALDLPFAAGSFDGAYMLHVGMNIADKGALFAGIRRVLKPGGFFGIYDIMRMEAGEGAGAGTGALRFPLPWASSAEASFVETAATYQRRLEAAGLHVSHLRSRRDFALDFFRQMRARQAESGKPPVLGLHILMGESFVQKMANMVEMLERNILAPTEIIARAI